MNISDIWMAAFLLANGAKLREVVPGYFCSFVFEADERLPELIRQWRDGDTLVDAREYAKASKQIRRAIREVAA
jgi:hypothetical protein